MDLFALGFQSYKDGMTEIQIKTQPPLFRAGWRAAKSEADSKSNAPASLKTEKVERFVNKPKYTVSWQDITSVMNLYPFSNISKVQELEPIEIGMKQRVWKNRESIRSFSDLKENISVVYLQVIDAAYKFKYINKSDLTKLGTKLVNDKIEFDEEQIAKVKYGL